jgi:hypothetical protein
MLVAPLEDGATNTFALPYPSSFSYNSLFIPRVITLSRPRNQFTLVIGIDLHSHGTESTISQAIARIITDDVLRAHIFGYLRGDRRNFAEISGEESATARIIGQADKQFLGFLTCRFTEE